MTQCSECHDAIVFCDEECDIQDCDVAEHNNAGTCPDCGAHLCRTCAPHECEWDKDGEL